MRSLRNVVALTGAVITLTLWTTAGYAGQTGTHKDWLRSDSKTQTARAGVASSGALTKSLIVLALLAGAGYFVWHRSRRTQQVVPAKQVHVRVLSGTAIGPKARAVVAEVGGRVILLGVTEHSVRRLAWLDCEPESLSEPDETHPRNRMGSEQQTQTPADRITARSDSSTPVLRSSKFSDVLRDAVGLGSRQVAEPVVALAENTRDRVVLKCKAPRAQQPTDHSNDFMNVEGQAAGLVARLNRRT